MAKDRLPGLDLGNGIDIPGSDGKLTFKGLPDVQKTFDGATLRTQGEGAAAAEGTADADQKKQAENAARRKQEQKENDRSAELRGGGPSAGDTKAHGHIGKEVYDNGDSIRIAATVEQPKTKAQYIKALLAAREKGWDTIFVYKGKGGDYDLEAAATIGRILSEDKRFTGMKLGPPVAQADLKSYLESLKEGDKAQDLKAADKRPADKDALPLSAKAEQFRDNAADATTPTADKVPLALVPRSNQPGLAISPP